jgi:hypothetical protein
MLLQAGGVLIFAPSISGSARCQKTGHMHDLRHTRACHPCGVVENESVWEAKAAYLEGMPEAEQRTTGGWWLHRIVLMLPGSGVGRS